MQSLDQDRLNHFRQRWAEENFNDSLYDTESRPNSSVVANEFTSINGVTNEEPITHLQDIREGSTPKQNSRQSWRTSLRSSLFARTQDKPTAEFGALPPMPPSKTPDEEKALSARNGIELSYKTESKILAEIYIVSWLIFFSLLGTLSRLGVEAITQYPNAPVTSRVLWANLGGSFIMGFLNEDRYLFPRYSSSSANKQTRQLRSSNSPSPSSSPSPEAKSEYNKFKKTIPLYVGLTTGFCGSFTSFSSFIRDAFLALTNDLESPSPTRPYHALSPIAPRSGGFSFLALLSILIIHPAISLIALQAGAQFAQLLTPIIPAIPASTLTRFINPLLIPLSLGCWLLATLTLSIIPPYQAVNWRSRALFPLLFSPLGCLTRYYLSKHMNPITPSFPLGTFSSNILATLVLGMCYDLQHAKLAGSDMAVSPNACAVLVGVMEGFCGCLSTVSTWVLELHTLKRKRGWIYGAASVGVGLAGLVCVMGGMGWTVGFAEPRCG